MIIETENKLKFGSSSRKIRTMEAHDIFPEELVEAILSRLPARQLLRLRCVSKSWCALIDNYRFIEKHHQVQYAKSREEGDIPFFLDSFSSNSSQFFLLSKKEGDEPMCLTADLHRDIAPYFTDDDMSPFITLCCIGVVSGIVGLSWREVHLGLWNPATREFKVVPSRPPNYINEFRVTFGLGLDPKSNDFKIVRSREVFGKSTNVLESVFVYEMYSLSTDSWKSLEEPLPNLFVDFSYTDGYFNGVYYWTAWERNRVYPPRGRYLILSFDFSREVFKLFDPPPAFISSEHSLNWRVGQYMEQLALIFSFENIGEQDSGRLYKPVAYDFEFEIWVACGFDVEDSGMSLSWQHLFTIRPIPDFSVLYHLCLDAFRIDGDLLLTLRWKGNKGSKVECCLYNSSKQTFKSVGLSVACGSCFGYVESLFSLSKRQVRNSDRQAIFSWGGGRRKRKRKIEAL